MSIAGLIDPEMSHSKKSFHRRNDSGELDVFEAARYFSGYNEAVSYNAASSTYTQKIISSERHHHHHNHHHRGRISLDMPMRSLLPQQFHGVVVDQKQVIMKDNNNNNNNNKKKHNKQPSSPGGRLASFLNSLFSQSASKKKKSSKSSSTQSMKDELDESPGGRRRRRSSISHFRFSSTASSAAIADSKSMYSSSLSSGFRTPPYVVQTPTKSCKEFRATSAKPKQTTATTLQKREPTSASPLDDGYKTVTTISNAELSERQRSWISGLAEKEKRWLEKYKAAGEDQDQNKGGITRFNEEVVDDGADSDSSSDLFELQNYDLGSGLPVYETTNMDNIKRGAPIPN